MIEKSADAAQSDLAERQAMFLGAILDHDAPQPPGWGDAQAEGMAVYRANYRSALMDGLAATFERTGRYVGEEAFRKARMHHAISHPPRGWTIDAVGEGFDRTCAQLFAHNPEVAELAWLEWSMLELATAPNAQTLSPEQFAGQSATFDDEDWANLRLQFQPRASARMVTGNLTALWQSLDGDGTGQPEPLLTRPMGCLVWREGERPTFLLVEAESARAFALVQQGASYGELIEHLIGDDPSPSGETIQNAAMRAGAMLGQWLREGMVIAVNP